MQCGRYPYIETTLKRLFRGFSLILAISQVSINSLFKILFQVFTRFSLLGDQTPDSQNFSIEKAILRTILDAARISFIFQIFHNSNSSLTCLI